MADKWKLPEWGPMPEYQLDGQLFSQITGPAASLVFFVVFDDQGEQLEHLNFKAWCGTLPRLYDQVAVTGSGGKVFVVRNVLHDFHEHDGLPVTSKFLRSIVILVPVQKQDPDPGPPLRVPNPII